MPDFKWQGKEFIVAKRHFTYDQLSSVVPGRWKPAGTLGSHHAVITHQGDVIVVVGSVSGKVSLHVGDTLGYNCGDVWAVPKPESYRDPLRRLLAERKISQKVLEFVKLKDFTLDTTERWYDQQHCPNGRPTHEWVTDGAKIIFEEEELEPSHGYFSGGGQRNIRIENATYAVRVDYGRHMNGCGYYRITRIVVWPVCDRTTLLEVVRKERHT